jgi:hypothetical protein
VARPDVYIAPNEPGLRGLPDHRWREHSRSAASACGWTLSHRQGIRVPDQSKETGGSHPPTLAVYSVCGLAIGVE